MSDTVRIVVEFPFVLTDRDRHGNTRYYFRRRKGDPKIRLRSKPGTPEFDAEYRAAADAKPPVSEGTPSRLLPPKPGTYRWLCVRYFESVEFKSLDPKTQHVRRQVLGHTWEEPISPTDDTPFADFPLGRMSAKTIRILRDRKAHEGLPEAANSRVKYIRRVFAWGLEHEHIDANPARDVAYVRNATQGHHAWTLEEVEQFEARHALGTKARLAMDLLLMTGLRRSDVVLLGRQHVRDGWIKLVLQKGKKRKPMTLELPMLPALQKAIEAGPTGPLTYLVTDYGQPFKVAGFGNWFRDRCVEAGVPGRAHGLRKAGATRVAELGATPHQLMALYGWLTLAEAERYTRQASRRKLAGEAAHMMMRETKS